jgi:hypothetical protein
MKPEITPIGNLFDRLSEVCMSSKDPPATYSVGDWVWARHRGHNQRLYLARIESAQTVRGRDGAELWLVRLYLSQKKHQARGYWGAPESRRVAKALNPAEVAHNRKLGLIPPAGQALP